MVREMVPRQYIMINLMPISQTMSMNGINQKETNMQKLSKG